jgi:hypothetical protein
MKRAKPGEAMIRTVGGVKVKRCAGCKVDHELTAFNQGTGPGGLGRHCREYLKKWRAERLAKRAAA